MAQTRGIHPISYDGRKIGRRGYNLDGWLRQQQYYPRGSSRAGEQRCFSEVSKLLCESASRLQLSRCPIRWQSCASSGTQEVLDDAGLRVWRRQDSSSARGMVSVLGGGRNVCRFWLSRSIEKGRARSVVVGIGWKGEGRCRTLYSAQVVFSIDWVSSVCELLGAVVWSIQCPSP